MTRSLTSGVAGLLPLLVSVGAGAIVLLGAGVGQADWYNWASSPAVHVTDPVDVSEPLAQGKEILGVWWARDAAYDHFRMDLAALPTLTDYADVYGVYLDSAPSRGAPASNGYLPHIPVFEGTDQIVMSDAVVGQFVSAEVRDWEGAGGPGHGPDVGWYTTALSPLESYFQQLTSAGSTGYEWRVPVAVLPDTFGFRGATFHPGDDGGELYDFTDRGDVPEPSTWVFFALGLPMVVWCRRWWLRRGVSRAVEPVADTLEPEV